MNRWPWIGLVVVGLLTALLTGCTQSVPAGSGPSPQAEVSKWPADVDGIVMYKGADREQMLLAGAKSEGKVTWYTSLSTSASQAVVDTFNQKYPQVKVELYRADTNALLQRVTEEVKANRVGFNLLNFSSTFFYPVQAAGWVRPVWSPGLEQLPAHARDKNGQWAAIFQLNFTVVYNTNLIPPDQAPKTYEDLVKPWGKPIAASGSDNEMFQAMIRMWGQDRAVKFYQDLLKNNKVKLETSRSKMVEMVSAGEYAMGFFVHNHDIEKFKSQGAPVDWVRLDPTVTSMSLMGVPKDLKNPHATMLYFDWMTSKAGYQALRDTGRITPHPDVPPDPPVLNQVPGFYPVLPDWAAKLEDESKLFQTTVGLR